MVRLETVFAAADGMTPKIAAELSKRAEGYTAEVSLECGDKQLRLDSLICILSLGLYRGVKVAVIAEGEDAQQAAEETVRVLQGE